MAKKKYYKRPDGLYETTRTVGGKRIRFRGRTCAEVDRKILAYQEDATKGRPFNVVAEEWFDSVEKNLSRSTQKVYRITLQHIVDQFGKTRLSDISPFDMQNAVRRHEAAGYARNSVCTYLSVLRQIFSHAVIAGDIRFNPASDVKISRNLPTKKRNALTEEQEALVEACRTGRWWLLGIMLLYTGCRRGELLALNWQDIDRNAKVIHITKKLDYSAGNTPVLDHHLKNSASRDIPLLAPLEAVLPNNRIGKIFTGTNGNYWTESELTRFWKEYCRDAGLMENGKPAVTPHCFRHSFSTICYEAGIDERSAAAFLGDTEEIMRGVYTELRSRHHANSAEKVSAYLEMRMEERKKA